MELSSHSNARCRRHGHAARCDPVRLVVWHGPPSLSGQQLMRAARRWTGKRQLRLSSESLAGRGAGTSAWGGVDSHKIGLGKVIALKEERFPGALSQGIGETVAEI